jgi:hypothetical protein
MFLITGCGYSGTKYTAMLLRRGGLSVGHEESGDDGAVSGGWCIDCERYPAFHQQGSRPDFDVILHQVRHPLDTISSHLSARNRLWWWNCRHISARECEPDIVKATSYWLEWNIKAEAQAELTYRIEHIAERWGEVMDAIGCNLDYDTCASGLSKKTNTHGGGVEVGWSDIPVGWRGAVRSLARRYGYE